VRKIGVSDSSRMFFFCRPLAAYAGDHRCSVYRVEGFERMKQLVGAWEGAADMRGRLGSGLVFQHSVYSNAFQIMLKYTT
jgi:hypothetical protein